MKRSTMFFLIVSTVVTALSMAMTVAQAGEPPATSLQPPYKLTGAEEQAIDKATDRSPVKAQARSETQKSLDSLLVQFNHCDKKDDPKTVVCTKRDSARIGMEIADRYSRLGQTSEAQAFYLEAMHRVATENTADEAAFEAQSKAPLDPSAGEAAHTMTVSYNAAKFHFQAFRDNAELARYQKRLVEIYIALGDSARAKQHWEMIENSIKTAANHQREFRKHFHALTGIKDKIPSKYLSYFNEIAGMAERQAVESF